MTTTAIPSGSDGSAARSERNQLKAETAKRPTIRLHIWLESQGEMYFGIGRAQLLFNIQSYGSIKKAAQNMGMSYRAAWGKIQQSEQALGLKLVEQRGARREGVRLTREGEEIADMFLAWFSAVERCALSSADSIFPFQVAGFGQKDT
jgi:N-terminal domain of molybdenum-binding protein